MVIRAVITVFHQLKWWEGRESISISNAITLVFGHIRNDGLTLFSQWAHVYRKEAVQDVTT